MYAFVARLPKDVFVSFVENEQITSAKLINSNADETLSVENDKGQIVILPFWKIIGFTPSKCYTLISKEPESTYPIRIQYGNQNMPFGKYKGKTINQIEEMNATYLNWAVKNIPEDKLIFSEALKAKYSY